MCEWSGVEWSGAVELNAKYIDITCCTVKRRCLGKKKMLVKRKRE